MEINKKIIAIKILMFIGAWLVVQAVGIGIAYLAIELNK